MNITTNIDIKNTVKNLVFSYSPNFEVREYVIKKANGYDRVFYK